MMGVFRGALNEVRTFTMTFYYRGWAKFEEALPGSFMLYPNKNSISKLKDDYNEMTEMIFGGSPSFEDVLDVIKKLENEINGLKNEYRT